MNDVFFVGRDQVITSQQSEASLRPTITTTTSTYLVVRNNNRMKLHVLLSGLVVRSDGIKV